MVQILYQIETYRVRVATKKKNRTLFWKEITECRGKNREIAHSFGKKLHSVLERIEKLHISLERNYRVPQKE